MNTILTIGYEGSTVEDFIATLKLAEVDVLIDIRDVPVSRKRGFSKKSLAEMLGTAGVEYVHLRSLGDPKEGRDAARRGDMETFERIFRAHLETDGAQDALGQALDISEGARACLLCFERNHAGCHRTIVANELASRESLSIRHIGVREGLAEKTEDDVNRFEFTYALG